MGCGRCNRGQAFSQAPWRAGAAIATVLVGRGCPAWEPWLRPEQSDPRSTVHGPPDHGGWGVSNREGGVPDSVSAVSAGGDLQGEARKAPPVPSVRATPIGLSEGDCVKANDRTGHAGLPQYGDVHGCGGRFRMYTRHTSAFASSRSGGSRNEAARLVHRRSSDVRALDGDSHACATSTGDAHDGRPAWCGRRRAPPSWRRLGRLGGSACTRDGGDPVRARRNRCIPGPRLVVEHSPRHGYALSPDQEHQARVGGRAVERVRPGGTRRAWAPA